MFGKTGIRGPSHIHTGTGTVHATWGRKWHGMVVTRCTIILGPEQRKVYKVTNKPVTCGNCLRSIRAKRGLEGPL